MFLKRIGASAAILLLAACGGGGSAGSDEPRPLAVGDEVRGEITSAARINMNDGSRSVAYEIDLAEGAVVEFELDAPLSGRLTLLENGVPVRQGATTSAGEALSYHAAAAGRRMLVVSGSSADAYGPFKLRAREGLEAQALPDGCVVQLGGSSPSTACRCTG